MDFTNFVPLWQEPRRRSASRNGVGHGDLRAGYGVKTVVLLSRSAQGIWAAPAGIIAALTSDARPTPVVRAALCLPRGIEYSTWRRVSTATIRHF